MMRLLNIVVHRIFLEIGIFFAKEQRKTTNSAIGGESHDLVAPIAAANN